ncbi:MAG: ABC transporter ATP-binding protein [Clostridia bacterium]
MKGLYRKYILRYPWPFAAALFCVACEAACDLLGPTIMARVLDDGISQHSLANVLHFGGLMLLCTLAGAGFAISRSILSSRVSQQIGADLRHDLFAKILRFSQQSADRLQASSLITRMTNDTTQVTQFVYGMMRIFIKAPLTCIGSIVLASLLNLKLSLIIYATVAMVGLLLGLSMKLSYPRFSKLQLAMDRINLVVQEYLLGVRLVKAFGTGKAEQARFSAANQSLQKQGISAQMVITLMSPLITFMVGLGTVLILALGGRMHAQGAVQAGDISAFIIYMTQMLSSLLMITNIFNTFVRTKASAARINEVFLAKEDAPPSLQPQALKGEVTFENVTFAYPSGSGAAVLKHLSFTVKPGESLAIIGPTGSGKTTLCWLLLRFYEATEGRILLDGQDIRLFDTATIRANIAIVPQKPMLFAGSIADNLLWGKPDATREEMAEALQQAQADFVHDMPAGVNSLLGGAGVNLSGGQKQRLSIARGLIKQAPVLLMDDATSALDAITEMHVRKALAACSAKHSLITVTQRCTTAMSASRILVLENGECVGLGTHAQLLRTCKPYIEIYRSQVDSGREAVKNV